MVLSVGEVWRNHRVPSYCAGWPASPGFLSDTRLTIVNFWFVLATVLIKTGVSNSAFVFDDAILIWLVPRDASLPLPLLVPVIAK